MFVYALLYIQVDHAPSSDILGVFRDYEKAVDELLERANYREIAGRLTQYMKYTEEYESFGQLRKLVQASGELKDVDIYRIIKYPLI